MQDGRDGDVDDGGLVAPIRTPRLLLRRVGARVRGIAGWRGGRAAGESFAIVERRTGMVIGAAGYEAVAGRPDAVALTIRIADAHEGRGYAAEATSAVADRAFCETATTILLCSDRDDAERTRRMAEASGFRFHAADAIFVLDRGTWVALAFAGATGHERSDAARHAA